MGAVFGRARPATGFATDLKSVMAMLPTAASKQGAISMPSLDDPALDLRARELRAQGEVVINCLSGSPDPQCDRYLVECEGHWQVKSLRLNDSD